MMEQAQMAKVPAPAGDRVRAVAKKAVATVGAAQIRVVAVDAAVPAEVAAAARMNEPRSLVRWSFSHPRALS